MATDNSQPRNQLILVLAVGTVLILFGLKFVFDSYFVGMMETEAKAKQAQPEELWKLRDDEKKKLEGSPVPIQKAMGDLVSKGRESSPLITPAPSDDQAPMVGWSQGTHALAAAAAGGAAPGDHHDAPVAAGSDAGVTTTTSATADAAKPDAGPPATAAKDAGPAVVPPPHH
jgi:hypothetical protein